MIKSRAMLLAGVSALAMLACAAEADAETFLFTGAVQSFPVLVSGEYSLDVFGASGGSGGFQGVGGLGAEVSGDIVLTAGETLTLFVGGQGQKAASASAAGAAAAAAASSSSEPVSLLSLAEAARGAMTVAVVPDRRGPPAEQGEAPLAGLAARAGAAAGEGPIAPVTAAAARAPTPAPRGATALVVCTDSVRNSRRAAPATRALATAASAAAAAAATTAGAEAGAGSPAAVAVAAAAPASVAAAAAPIWRNCSPAKS
jgi:trimeric autotransporter adhesin